MACHAATHRSCNCNSRAHSPMPDTKSPSPACAPHVRDCAIARLRDFCCLTNSVRPRPQNTLKTPFQNAHAPIRAVSLLQRSNRKTPNFRRFRHAKQPLHPHPGCAQGRQTERKTEKQKKQVKSTGQCFVSTRMPVYDNHSSMATTSPRCTLRKLCKPKYAPDL